MRLRVAGSGDAKRAGGVGNGSRGMGVWEWAFRDERHLESSEDMLVR